MKQIIVSGNRPCFCNSGKKFKLCHGMGASAEVLDTYAMNFLLRDVYHKVIMFVKGHYDINEFLGHFKTYNKISEENTSNHELSFIFIDFLLFRAKFKDNENKNLINEVLVGAALTPAEKEFLEDLKKTAKFSIFRILDVDIEKSSVKLVNIFTKDEFSFYDKNCASVIHKDGLLYGKIFNVLGRYGVLPTFNFRAADSVKLTEMDKIVESFEKRFNNLKEKDEDLVFNDFIDSIEYEIYGGDNPYEEFDMEDRFEKFKKENPGKDIDEFLDEVENELLNLK